MFEGLSKQIGPGIVCPEFVGECIDYGFIVIVIGTILGAIIGMIYYHRRTRRSKA